MFQKRKCTPKYPHFIAFYDSFCTSGLMNPNSSFKKKLLEQQKYSKGKGKVVPVL
jgi:hypothetical protein